MRDGRAGAGAAALIVLAAVVACAPVSSAPTEMPNGTDVDATITSRDLEFDLASITRAPASAWRLRLVNEDAAPHNVAIYSDASATTSLFVREVVAMTTIEYEIPALEPGTYYFRCDLHPEMDGTLIVGA